MLEVRSVIREPPPAAITTAWNSMLQREHRGRVSLNHDRTRWARAGPGQAESSRAKTGSVQRRPTLAASASQLSVRRLPASPRPSQPVQSRRAFPPPRRYLRSAGHRLPAPH